MCCLLDVLPRKQLADWSTHGVSISRVIGCIWNKTVYDTHSLSHSTHGLQIKKTFLEWLFNCSFYCQSSGWIFLQIERSVSFAVPCFPVCYCYNYSFGHSPVIVHHSILHHSICPCLATLHQSQTMQTARISSQLFPSTREGVSE